MEGPDQPVDILRAFTLECVDAYLNHNQINIFLNIFRQHRCFSHWPKDARTILKTPREPGNICPLSGGKYVHFGLETAIVDILKETPTDLIPNQSIIDFSTDGVPIENGGKVNDWPIQIRVHNMSRSAPKFVGIWCGTSYKTKPNDANGFFTQFVDDFIQIVNANGVTFNGQPITYGSFIADALARAFILGHFGHNSMVPCSRSIIGRQPIGVGSNRTTLRYEKNICHPRADEDYKNRTDQLHHNPLSRLPGFNCVKRTVFDWMHAVLLGKVKRTICKLNTGKGNPAIKLSETDIEKINVRLNLIKEHCPVDFSRHPLDISHYSNLKETEFQQIL